jgi:dolichol-phosphate mannosyltransferase
VAEALLAMPERDRFIRGMVSWLGFSQVAVPYRRAARLAGQTKYPLFKMVRFAADGIVSFSTTPLRIATWFGFIVSGFAVIGILVTLYARLFEKDWVKGWASTVIPVLFLGGVQLICLGIIGEYVGRIYGESKRRPLYLVRERLGFDLPNRITEINSIDSSAKFERGALGGTQQLPGPEQKQSSRLDNLDSHGELGHPMQTEPNEKLKPR